MRQGDRWVLSVHGKGAKNRIVPIADKLAEMLQTWQWQTKNEGRILRRLYKGSKLGDSLGLTAIYMLVQRYGNLVGHENLQPHDLRRTYAQIGYESAIPLTQISKLLGHSSLAVTQRYLNIDLNSLVFPNRIGGTGAKKGELRDDKCMKTTNANPPIAVNYQVQEAIEQMVSTLPKGTDLGLCDVMSAMYSGYFVEAGGGIIPAVDQYLRGFLSLDF